MSYQGLRIDRNKKIWVRFRVKGQVEEKGPYDSYASALAEHMGCGAVDRHTPSDVKSTSVRQPPAVSPSEGVKS